MSGGDLAKPPWPVDYVAQHFGSSVLPKVALFSAECTGGVAEQVEAAQQCQQTVSQQKHTIGSIQGIYSHF